MTWRGSTTIKDRIFACLPYLLPLVDGIGFGVLLFAQFPPLRVLLVILSPVLAVYGILPFGRFNGLIIFFALFLLVVRNEKIAHFIRFNTMQAILLDIVLSLSGLFINLLRPVPGANFAIETLMNTIFIGLLVAVVYSVAQSIMGKYAEIPAISDAVYTQVR